MIPRRSFLAVGVVVPAALLVGQRPARAECAEIPDVARFVTPSGSPMPVGTVLVASLDRARGPVVGLARGAFPTTATLTRGRQRIALRLRDLGGKLALLEPVRPPARGRWRVTGVVGSPSIEFAGVALPPPAAPPRALRIGRTVTVPATPMSGPSVLATLRLEHPPGPTFLAVAGWWDVPVGGHPASSSATLAAQSDPAYSSVTDGGDVQIAWVEGQCGDSRGAVPTAGQSATIVWIDVYGRRSTPVPVSVVAE